MRPGVADGRVPLLAAAVPAAALSAVMLALFGRDMFMIAMRVHFVVVGLAGLVALGAALALTFVGARAGDGRAVLVGTAFSTMASMLFVHAIATPGVLIGDNGLVQLAGAGNLPAAAFVLALAGWPALNRPASMRPLLALQAGILACVAVVGTVGMVDPGAIPILPGPGGSAATLVLVLGLGLLAVLVHRSARTFLLSRRAADLAVVVGLVLLGGAQAGLLLYGMMDLGFWLAHVFEVAGIALVGVPVALDLRRGAQSYPLVGDLSAVQIVAEEEAFVGARVRALMVRLAEKDAYTEQHTRNVAVLAVQIGEHLGLSPIRLRTLAVGGLLHDMGKLSVPNRILQKPGRLEEDEFAVIRRHPTWGDELLGELGGFAPAVRRLVLSHHERLDGKGYPHGLRADELDLETRILTVADVYDALVSKRVYRDAWPQERALALLHEETGSAFDARCVQALEEVLREPAQAPAARLAHTGLPAIA
ncbi:MAG TPA: HD-GYP domain-containing protein [Gaiellaceae bacterium]|nr:HD-GYP domain-containing protein [Gaiellaceae bacterium]